MKFLCQLVQKAQTDTHTHTHTHTHTTKTLPLPHTREVIRNFFISFQWNLVCSKSHLVANASSAYWVGVVLGLLVGGHLADRYIFIVSMQHQLNNSSGRFRISPRGMDPLGRRGPIWPHFGKLKRKNERTLMLKGVCPGFTPVDPPMNYSNPFTETSLANSADEETNSPKILWTLISYSVADPGFPVGRRGPRRGACTPEAVMFRKSCMSKRKNLDPWGGMRRASAYVDPPMLF